MTEVDINASKTYKIYIGDKLLDNVGKMIKSQCGGSKACIVCGDIVENIYSQKIGEQLTGAGYDTYLFVYPHGEQSKNLEVYGRLINFLAECNMTRTDVLVALGGGVTGDLTGFAAATYLRGIKFVQLPTTLLSMVDSSVGGKTGVDIPSGKNLVGAFWQPEMVICDYSTLETLPLENFYDGCAEIVKYAILRDPEIIDLLSKPFENVEKIIEKCLVIKRDIVNEDEFETGNRKLLNLGHTVAHAIEKLSNYEITHGQAVAIGTAVITRAANESGDCDDSVVNTITEVLSKLSLPTETDYKIDDIFEVIKTDKKRNGDSISLIIPKYIGKCEIRKLTLGQAKQYIEKGLY